jgi:hypothetical protein
MIIVLLLLLVGFQAEAAVPSHGEVMAGYLANKVNHVENQKQLIEKLSLGEKRKKETIDFLKKYRQEGIPVPAANSKGTVLNLIFKQGPKLVTVAIDFAGIDEGKFAIGDTQVVITDEDSLDSIYNKIESVVAKVESRNLFISQAFAEEPKDKKFIETRRTYAVLMIAAANVNKDITPFQIFMENFTSLNVKIISWDCQAKTVSTKTTDSPPQIKTNIQVYPESVFAACCNDKQCKADMKKEIKTNSAKQWPGKGGGKGTGSEDRNIPTH